MATDRGLMLRGGKWQVIVTVPKDLQGTYGTKQIWRTTGTGDKLEARRKAVAIRAEIEADFARRRRARDNTRPVRLYPDHVLEAFARELYDYELWHDEVERNFVMMGKPDDEPEKGPIKLVGAVYRQSMIEMMSAGITEGNYQFVDWWVAHVIHRDGLTILPDTPDYKFLAYSCQRFWVEAMRIRAERDRGNFAAVPTDPIITTPKAAPKPKAESIKALFEKFATMNPNSVKADKLETDCYAVQLLVEHVGDVSPSDISRADIRNWHDLLAQFPSRASQMDCFKGMGIGEVFAANKLINKSVIDRKTVNKHLSAISVFLDWTISEGYRDSPNPCEGLAYAKDKSKKVQIFTKDDIESILRSDWFDGERDHRYWLPLLALYSGARLGELAQILTADVKELHGRWCLHITGEGSDENSVKNTNSERVVPIHPKLVELGFLDYVASQTGKQLFPKATRNSRGQWVSDVSRDFGRLLNRLAIRDDAGPKVDFHSFRHTFADGMRKAGFADNEFDLLLGHRGTMTGRYGIDKSHMVERKSDMIDALDYGIDVVSILKSDR